MKSEPVAIIGTVAAAIVAVIQVLGPEYFPDLTEPVIAAIQAVVVLVAAVLARSRVSPV